MILSDYDILNAVAAKRVVIRPFRKEHVRENGIDFVLDDEIAFRKPVLDPSAVFDPTDPEQVKNEYTVETGKDRLVLRAGSQVLLSTEESLRLPNDIMAFVQLRSTWARHGLSIPPTIIDAGFSGNLTLAVTNAAQYSIMMKPGMRFVHVVFAKLMSSAANSYKGAYLNQEGLWLPKVIK
ncbi:MAG: dCTP deaminase [Candidatus Micrarchaeota archaeon]|nr:dCTP deaminase [Candidatus Micrarchaeota archaeon]